MREHLWTEHDKEAASPAAGTPAHATRNRTPFLRSLQNATRASNLLQAFSGAPVLWALLASDGSPARVIHSHFRRRCWREHGVAGALVLVAGCVLLLPVMLVMTGMCTWRCGARVRGETGKGYGRQALEQMWLALTVAVPAPWYYIFELYLGERRRSAGEYLYRTEMKSGIYDMLRARYSSQATTLALRNKALFVQRCEQHGVAAITALATASGGVIRRYDGFPGLPPRDLFFKPISGAGGRGASRWIYRDDALYQGNDGRLMSEQQLVDHLQALSMDKDYVVRLCVRNHPALANLSAGALNTARVVTCLNESGEPEITHAVLRMASNSDVVVDNFHAGGIAAAIDIESGKLGLATDMGMQADSQWWAIHPATGGPIAGRTMPCWDEVLALVIRAHHAFADQIAIGWDVAILADGPSLVEGNKSPDLDIIQRIVREPVGNSRLGELLALYLQRGFSN